LRAAPSGLPCLGQGAFVAAAEELTNQLSVVFSPPLDQRTDWEFVSGHVSRVCLSPKSDFGHYFRTLYHLLKLIDRSEIESKHRYAALLRAQCSNAELLLVLANGLTEIGRRKFKPLIENYELLKPLRTDSQETAPLARLRSYYSESAFGL
jgi:hypothetical protein